MALKGSKLEEIPQRNKDLAFGYIKECELKNKSVIPKMIKYLCLIYLNINKDRFHPNYIHKNVKVTGNTVTTKIYGYVNAYLENIITKGIHIWRFRINNNIDIGNRLDAIGIGKVTPLSPRLKADLLEEFFEDDMSDSGSICTNPAMDKCKIGDILSMMVDCTKWTLSYKVNDEKYIKSRDIQPGKYRAGITLTARSSYSLMSYQMIF